MMAWYRVLIAVAGLAGPLGAAAQATRTEVKGSSGAALTAAQRRALLRDPARAFWRARAPDTVTLDVETSRGAFRVELVREWAPFGVDRLYALALAGYFDDSRFFRVVPAYIAQFGIAGDPAVAAIWRNRRIRADSVRATNTRGTLSFAQYSRTDRTTNVFINLRDNVALDSLGFAPVGRVTQGMEVVDSLYAGYGEVPAMPPPLGNPRRLYAESNRYLDQEFPRLDRILAITVRR